MSNLKKIFCTASLRKLMVLFVLLLFVYALALTIPLRIRSRISIEESYASNSVVLLEHNTIGSELSPLQEIILYLNKLEKIYNEEIYGQVSQESLVIVIQVHTRSFYLEYLIESLRQSRDIEKALLVFSHDYYDEELNDLVRSIKFCKFIQIFYPYSIQLYPNTFPGNETIDTSLTDPRNGTTVQTKHHWWWKANKAFNLRALKDYAGFLVFIEEDVYVGKDFIFMAKLVENSISSLCADCIFTSLACNQHAVNIDKVNLELVDQVEVTQDLSNMGLAFNKVTWKKVLACKESFCTYDDYNWDFSLHNLFRKCTKNTRTMNLLYPRLIHLGLCGTHFKSKDCNPSDLIDRWNKKINPIKNKLFPKTIKVKERKVAPSFRSNGGWKDTRDHQLCLNATNM